MDLRTRIKRWRESRGLSKAELARRVGKTRSAIVQWEQGKSAPSRETTEALAGVFGVSIPAFWGSAPRAKRVT